MFNRQGSADCFVDLGAEERPAKSGEKCRKSTKEGEGEFSPSPEKEKASSRIPLTSWRAEEVLLGSCWTATVMT